MHEFLLFRSERLVFHDVHTPLFTGYTSFCFRYRICAMSNDVIVLEEILGYVLEALDVIEVLYQYFYYFHYY